MKCIDWINICTHLNFSCTRQKISWNRKKKFEKKRIHTDANICTGKWKNERNFYYSIFILIRMHATIWVYLHYLMRLYQFFRCWMMAVSFVSIYFEYWKEFFNSCEWKKEREKNERKRLLMMSFSWNQFTVCSCVYVFYFFSWFQVLKDSLETVAIFNVEEQMHSGCCRFVLECINKIQI